MDYSCVLGLISSSCVTQGLQSGCEIERNSLRHTHTAVSAEALLTALNADEVL